MERILAVEGDIVFRNLYSELLKGEGYEVDTAPSGQKALEFLSRENYQLVITELVVHDMSGLDLLSKVKQHDPSIDVIVVTGHADVETAIYALKNGARDYLVKPFNHDEFKHTVALCLEQRRLLDENLELKGLLNLYQIGQTIANCLDLERLYPLVVDSVAKEARVERALGLFLDDGNLVLKEARGVGEEQANSLSRMLLPEVVRSDGSAVHIKPLQTPAPPAETAVELPAGFDEAVMLFIRSKTTLHGVVLLFNDPGKSLADSLDHKNLHFILDQASLAFENATRYTMVKNLIYIDELTGLYNYRYLEVALEREIRRAERYSSNISVIFIDLDLFKNVNDRYGHLIGSRVLREMGALLKRSVRDVDTVIRYGGDEFTIILVETNARGATAVAERIRRAVQESLFLMEDGYEIKLTACLGYACYPEDTRSKQELLAMADEAMYRGKTSGRNMVFRALHG